MTFPSYLPVTAEFFNVSVSFPSSPFLSPLLPPFDTHTTSRPAKLIYMHTVRPPDQRFCLALCCFLLVRLGKEALGGFEFGCY